MDSDGFRGLKLNTKISLPFPGDVQILWTAISVVSVGNDGDCIPIYLEETGKAVLFVLEVISLASPLQLPKDG